MKIGVYNLRPDEQEFFDAFGAAHPDLEILAIRTAPNRETATLAAGCRAVSITSDSPIDREVLDVFQAQGVEFISTRTIGYEHLDLDYARAIGIQCASIDYSPESVADYAIMLMLMVTRNVKHMMVRAAGQDFALTKLRGRELKNMTVGILGTGRIGAATAKHVAGFGCRVLACGHGENPALKGIADYVDFDTLLAESDILSLHIPGSARNTHIVNRETFAKMKPGAVLINTARGSLVDNTALIEALESGRISGAGLDVFDGDRLILYRDRKGQMLRHREMAILNSMPNVILLPHMAFWTDQAVKDMVEHSMESCAAFAHGTEIPGLL